MEIRTSSGATSNSELRILEICLQDLKSRFPDWRAAFTDWTRIAPARLAMRPPAPYFVWALESGDLDTDPGGFDDPADQIYFAVRDGLIKIGWSSSPQRRLSSACTLTRTALASARHESMLHLLFAQARVWRDDRPERSSSEWYAPTPFLVRLAKAGDVLKREQADRLALQCLNDRFPNGLPPIAIPRKEG